MKLDDIPDILRLSKCTEVMTITVGHDCTDEGASEIAQRAVKLLKKTGLAGDGTIHVTMNADKLYFYIDEFVMKQFLPEGWN